MVNPLGDGAGFLILSTGFDRKDLLNECLASIRRHYPGAPVHVLTDLPTDEPFTWLEPGKGGTINDLDSRRYKTSLNRYTPFQTTVFLDDDTVIHKPFGTAEDQLRGQLVAMVPDGSYTSLGDWRARARSTAGDWSDAAKRSIPESHTGYPYYSSGVMIWRKDHLTDRMFELWNRHWMQYGRRDQQPLVTALIESGLYEGEHIRTLPVEMNFVPERHCAGVLGFTPQTFREFTGVNIIHFWKNKKASVERYVEEMGFQPSTFGWRGVQFMALRHPSRHQMSADQYRSIGMDINARANSHRYGMSRDFPGMAPRVLVFGCGQDSQFWCSLNPNGTNLFVESDPRWEHDRGDGMNAQTYRPVYDSTLGVWYQSKGPIPFELQKRWDVIVVDAPTGHRPGTPGREVPIWWASLISRSSFRSPGMTVYVHDYQRPWERACCDRYLGPPDGVIKGDEIQRAPDRFGRPKPARNRGDLAIWRF